MFLGKLKLSISPFHQLILNQKTPFPLVPDASNVGPHSLVFRAVGVT